MNIYTLTFHRADNYGAVLQTYALQKKLISLGANSLVLDYRSKGIESQYRIYQFNKSIPIKAQILDKSKSILRISQAKRFAHFRRRIKTTNVTDEKFAGIIHTGDVIVVGSDQVWNYTSTFNDKTYFLNKISDNVLKYSYAASFGSDSFTEDFTKEVTPLLKKFRGVSLREQSGYNFVKNTVGIPCYHHVDPVFLRSKEEWMDDTKGVKSVYDKRYVLVYQLLYSQKMLDYAQELAKNKGLDVVIISRSTHINKGFINRSNSGPLEFLWLFQHSECVITNSFHGTAFSIIFNKEFYLDFNEGVKTKTRIESICELLGIGDRWITAKRIVPINYSVTNELLHQQVEKATEYLKGIIDGDNKSI